MKIGIRDTKNIEKGKIDLPKQFSEPIREDVIAKAFYVIQSHKRQPYGADPRAGKKQSGKLSRRRHKYKTSYGIGISRVPRKIMSHRGERFNWVGAVAPGTVGGRRAHHPKAEKIWEQKINKKERRKAIRSAMAAVINKEIVGERGHKLADDYPFIITDEFENITKTKELEKALIEIGLKAELERTKQKKVRAGKGKMRNRKYRKKTGPLLVVSNDCSLLKCSENIPGINVVKIEEINVELLAPGAVPGRLTLFTESAIKKIDKEKLFTEEYKGTKEEKIKETKKAKSAKKEEKKQEKKKEEKKAE